MPFINIFPKVMPQFSLINIPPYSFLIELKQLREVLSQQKIAPVPRAPKYIQGVTALRGDICTVLCIPTLLDYKKPEMEQRQLVVIDHKLGQFAFTAESVDIVSIEEHIISPPTGLPFLEWTKGMIQLSNGQDAFLLDLAMLERIVSS